MAEMPKHVTTSFFEYKLPLYTLILSRRSCY